MKRIILYSGLMLLILSTVAGCTGSNTANTELSSTGKWELDSLGGFTRPKQRTANAVMTFEKEGVLNGHGGCNVFSGSYNQNGWQLTIEEILSTETACMESQTEALLFAALQKSARYSLTKSRTRLNLFDINGALLCSFNKN